MSVKAWLHRNLARRKARSHASPRFVEQLQSLPIKLDGTTMRDDERLEDYPGALTRSFRKYEWPLSGRNGDQILSVFRLAGAVVTRCYLSIDPSRARLFINQSYDDVQLLWPLSHIWKDGYFRFESSDLICIPGQVAVIGGPIDLNYYHWMLNWLQRLFLFETISPDLYNDPATLFLVDERAQREPFASFLRLIGIPADRIIWSDHLKDYRLEQAVLASFISQNAYYPELLSAMTDRLRQGMGWQPGPPHRRIFIDRQKLDAPKRRVANMDEIAPLLDDFGFERIILEDLPLEEQIRAFSEAEAVAGVHGAGLANLIFCPPGCRVLLLEKPWSIEIGLARTFAVLAEACGLACETLAVAGHKVEGTAYDTLFDNHHQDVVIDGAAFEAALRRTCPVDAAN